MEGPIPTISVKDDALASVLESLVVGVGKSVVFVGNIISQATTLCTTNGTTGALSEVTAGGFTGEMSFISIFAT
jgi:hypothetical protein